MVRYLVFDGKDGRVGVRGGEVGEDRVDFVGVLDLVNVVLGEGVVDADGQAGPDDVVWVNGWDEERDLGGLDVVGQIAVGKVATRQVKEVSALS